MESMRIRLLQSPTVEWDGNEILFPYKKAAGLFYYLCVKKSATREEIINLLWADGEEAAGRKSLREALYQIKKKVGEDFLILSGQSQIKVNPEFPVWIDVDDEAGILENYHGDFLQNFYIKNCYEFEEWTEETKNHYLNRYLEEVRRCLDLAAASRDRERMEKYTTILTKKDPYNESIYRHAMDAFAVIGDYNMAIKLYYDLRKRLKDELSMEPGEEIQSQMQRIFQIKENMMGGVMHQAEYFFGRNMEVYRLHDRIGKLIRGDKVASMVVEGDVGVGKTALLEKVRHMTNSHRAIVLSASCYESEQGFYLKPWQDMFLQLESYASQGKISLEPEECALFHNFLRSSVDAGGEGLPASCMMLERTLLEVVGRLSGQWKILIFMDDIQWIDPMSVQLLQRLLLAYGGRSVLLMAAMRPCEENHFLDAMEVLMRRDLLERMELMNFSREETKEIICRLLPEVGGQEEKTDAIYRETEGNALFLIELLNEMRDKGYTLDIPKKTASVLASRLARLTKEENQVLDAMSIFIERGGIEELEVLLPMPRLTLLEVLEELARKHMVQESVVGSEVYYRFHHKLYWEFVYGRQSEGKKRHWHGEIAAFYEKAYLREKSLSYLPVMAYHYERCGNVRKRYQYQLQYMKESFAVSNENYPVLHKDLITGEDTLDEQGGTGEMISLAREVIRMEDISGESKALKMESYYLLGRYDIAVGEYQEGLAAIRASIRLAGELGDGQTLLNGCKQMIFYGIQVRDMEIIGDYIRAGRAVLLEIGTEGDRAVFDRLEAVYLRYQGRFDEAEEMLRRIIEYYEGLELGGEDVAMGVAACCNYLGEICRDRGHLEEACAWFRKALAGDGGKYQVNGTAQLYSNLGQVLLEMGAREEAREPLLRATECFRRNDYRWGWDKAEAYLCRLELEAGNRVAAKAHFEKAKQLGEQMKTPETLAMIQQLGKQLA